jgi:hypothetical protein
VSAAARTADAPSSDRARTTLGRPDAWEGKPPRRNLLCLTGCPADHSEHFVAVIYKHYRSRGGGHVHVRS